MLKQSYPNLDAVPENLKGAYVADASGEYVLDKLDAEHPVVKQNATLVKENTAYRGTNTKLTNEKAELEAKSLPEGHIAVPKAEYTQLKTELESLKTETEGYKALGTLDEIKPKIEGYEGLKSENKAALRDRALMAAGVKDINRARDFKSYDSLDIEIEKKDGKEVFYSVTTDDKGTNRVEFTTDFLKSDAYKDNLGSLLQGGTKFFKQGTGASDTAPSALAEEHMKKRYTGIAAKT